METIVFPTFRKDQEFTAKVVSNEFAISVVNMTDEMADGKTTLTAIAVIEDEVSVEDILTGDVVTEKEFNEAYIKAKAMLFKHII